MSDDNHIPSGQAMRGIFAAMAKQEAKPPTLADAVAALQSVAEETADALRALLGTILCAPNRRHIPTELVKQAEQINERLKLWTEP